MKFLLFDDVSFNGTINPEPGEIGIVTRSSVELVSKKLGMDLVVPGATGDPMKGTGAIVDEVATDSGEGVSGHTTSILVAGVCDNLSCRISAPFSGRTYLRFFRAPAARAQPIAVEYMYA